LTPFYKLTFFVCDFQPTKAPGILMAENRDARWVKPVITLKVKHLAFGCGLMRHATVKGLVQ